MEHTCSEVRLLGLQLEPEYEELTQIAMELNDEQTADICLAGLKTNMKSS